MGRAFKIQILITAFLCLGPVVADEARVIEVEITSASWLEPLVNHCQAVAVSPSKILTAAHCFEKIKPPYHLTLKFKDSRGRSLSFKVAPKIAIAPGFKETIALTDPQRAEKQLRIATSDIAVVSLDSAITALPVTPFKKTLLSLDTATYQVGGLDSIQIEKPEDCVPQATTVKIDSLVQQAIRWQKQEATLNWLRVSEGKSSRLIEEGDSGTPVFDPATGDLVGITSGFFAAKQVSFLAPPQADLSKSQFVEAANLQSEANLKFLHQQGIDPAADQ